MAASEPSPVPYSRWNITFCAASSGEEVGAAVVKFEGLIEFFFIAASKALPETPSYLPSCSLAFAYISGVKLPFPFKALLERLFSSLKKS